MTRTAEYYYYKSKYQIEQQGKYGFFRDTRRWRVWKQEGEYSDKLNHIATFYDLWRAREYADWRVAQDVKYNIGYSNCADIPSTPEIAA